MTINDEALMFKWNKTKDTQISSNLNSFHINFEGSVKYRQMLRHAESKKKERERRLW